MTHKREFLFNVILYTFLLIMIVQVFLILTRLAVVISVEANMRPSQVSLEEDAGGRARNGIPWKKKESVVEYLAGKYVALFFPKISYLPKKIIHPLWQGVTIQEHMKDAYYDDQVVGKTFVGHPPMSFTPHVMYAPAVTKEKKYFHNAQQFRYPEDLSAKRDSEVRIFITGGSTAWGFAAPSIDATISAYLERELNSTYKNTEVFFRVVNAAAGGWTTTEERIWILNQITEYEADIVISYSGHNDVDGAYKGKDDLFTYLHDDAAYQVCALQEYERYNRGDATASMLSRTFSQHYAPSDFPRKTLKNIAITAYYLQSMSCEYVFILQPTNSVPKLQSMEMLRVLEKELFAYEKKTPFTFVSHLDLLNGKQKLFLDECHFGDIGNEIVAKQIAVDIQPLLAEIIAKQIAANDNKEAA